MATKQSTAKTKGSYYFETLDTAHDERVNSTVLVDLRKQPRFETSFPAKAFVPNGEHLIVTIANLSLSGLQLEIPRRTVRALLAELDNHALETGLDPLVEVHFSVPSASDRIALVKARCKMIYTRRAKLDTHQIGMKFVSFGQGRAALVDYLWQRGAGR